MDYVNLGRSGLRVSRLCLGGNSWGSKGHRDWAALDAADSKPFFKHALDCGINFFDTADTYSRGGSEEAIGAGLLPMTGRQELVLCTKVGWSIGDKPNSGGLGRKHVMASIDASLKRLRTDHVDLYMIHCHDPLTPTEEVMTTLGDIVRSGKARYLAASNMRATQFARLQLFAKTNGLPAFVAMQNLYNLLDREQEREMIPFCAEEGVGVTPYSPLARGVLSGKRRREGGGDSERAQRDKQAANYHDEASFAIVERVIACAQARGVQPSQIALAWLLQNPAIAAPVIGVTRLAQIDEAASALDIKLDAGEIAKLQELYQPRPARL